MYTAIFKIQDYFWLRNLSRSFSKYSGRGAETSVYVPVPGCMNPIVIACVSAPAGEADFSTSHRRCLPEADARCLQMDPDLMSATGLQFKFHIGGVGKGFQYPIMGNRRFSVFLIDRHFFPLCGMSADRSLYPSCRFFHDA